MLDDHGQPLNRRYSGKRLNDRTIDELIGISRGLIADKNINQTEAEFLHSLLQTNLPYCNDPIVNKLYCRVSEMLKDRVLDLDEQKELLQILSEFTGESTIVHCQTLSSSLPLCSPPLLPYREVRLRSTKHMRRSGNRTGRNRDRHSHPKDGLPRSGNLLQHRLAAYLVWPKNHEGIRAAGEGYKIFDYL